MEIHVGRRLNTKGRLVKKIAKNVKTETDLGNFYKLLRKIVVEKALDAELTDHLNYDKACPKDNGSGNASPSPRQLIVSENPPMPTS